MPETKPDISIVVASHDRPLRLRWLLNALEHQTVPRERWEIVVGHDSAGPATNELLETHSLAADGTLRYACLPPGTAPPGANRNAALKIARADTIVFTDDDCRPPADWIENWLEAKERAPDAIIQGTTVKDPTELVITHAPHLHSVTAFGPTPWAECTNILYPRHWIDAVGGFDDHQMTGEDTDLNLRCQKAGATYTGDRSVVTFHAVVEVTFRQVLRGRWRWKDLPYLIKKHPDFRQHFPLWIFWKRTHTWFPFFLFGLWGIRRKSLVFGVLCTPYMVHSVGARGTNPRGRFRDLIEWPTHVAVDVVEMAALIHGSVKYRTFFI